jgi:hypothetical protein
VRPLNTFLNPNDVKSRSAGAGFPVINTGQAPCFRSGFGNRLNTPEAHKPSVWLFLAGFIRAKKKREANRIVPSHNYYI